MNFSTRTLETISEQLDRIDKLKTKQEKIIGLQAMPHRKAILTLLDATFNPNLTWRVPSGIPPFKSTTISAVNQLYQAMSSFYIYFVGQAPGLSRTQIEQKYILLLESLDPKDAELVSYIKDNRKLPQKTLTKKLVEEAFPEAVARWTDTKVAV